MQHTQPISVRATSESIDGCVLSLQDKIVSAEAPGDEYLLSGDATVGPRAGKAGTHARRRLPWLEHDAMADRH